MNDADLLHLIIAGSILLLLVIVYETFIEPRQNKKPANCELLTSKAVLIRSILHFSEPILAEKNIAHFPSYKIYYHPHKKWAGCFCARHVMIYIYLKNNNSVVELVNTVLHELGHYVQSKTDPDWFSNYDDYTEAFGYYNNPLEIDSRSFAEEWTTPCLFYLRDQKIIDFP